MAARVRIVSGIALVVAGAGCVMAWIVPGVNTLYDLFCGAMFGAAFAFLLASADPGERT